MLAASDKRSKGSSRVAVIGAGVVGLSCALELTQCGADVTVYERGDKLGAGVTVRSAGMLGVGFEWVGEDQLHLAALAKRAGEIWPDLAGRLGAVDLSSNGALVVARSIAELEWIDGIVHACAERDVEAIPLSPAELRNVEPAISGDVEGGLLLPADRQVDAGLVLERLGVALGRMEVGLSFGQTVERIIAGERFLAPDGERFDHVVLATGAGAPPAFLDEGGGILKTGLPDIVPVKGQMLAVARMSGAPRHVIHTQDVYIAPKAGRILIGATVERGRADTVVDPEVISGMKARAASIVGRLADAADLATWAGIRPGTPDDAPLIGETALRGVFAAMGHYRNGILFAPATAEIIAEQSIDGKVSPMARPFDARRFDKRAASSHSRTAKG